MSKVDSNANESFTRILVGNKNDLEDKRQVPYSEG
jgi:GTPase SAR1 family protein